MDVRGDAPRGRPRGPRLRPIAVPVAAIIEGGLAINAMAALRLH